MTSRTKLNLAVATFNLCHGCQRRVRNVDRTAGARANACAATQPACPLAAIDSLRRLVGGPLGGRGLDLLGLQELVVLDEAPLANWPLEQLHPLFDEGELRLLTSQSGRETLGLVFSSRRLEVVAAAAGELREVGRPCQAALFWDRVAGVHFLAVHVHAPHGMDRRELEAALAPTLEKLGRRADRALGEGGARTARAVALGDWNDEHHAAWRGLRLDAWRPGLVVSCPARPPGSCCDASSGPFGRGGALRANDYVLGSEAFPATPNETVAGTSGSDHRPVGCVLEIRVTPARGATQSYGTARYK
jgi:hypothetical protein